jgi:hypothetical protein
MWPGSTLSAWWLAALGLVVVLLVLLSLYQRQQQKTSQANELYLKRRAFIESYEFSETLRHKLGHEFPRLSNNQVSLVLEGLRQWFLVCLETRTHNQGMAGMPSRSVDIAWHEFILITREYENFCNHAYGGFLHHSPEPTMETPMPQALGTTLTLASVGAVGVPLLFAIDDELGLSDGYSYTTEDLDTFREEHELEVKRAASGDGYVPISGDSGDDGSAGPSGDSGGSSCGGGCGGS